MVRNSDVSRWVARYLVPIAVLVSLLACDLPFSFFATATPQPSPTPTDTPMPTITPTPTLTPTPTPPYDIEERAELIDLCRSLQDYFDEEDNYLVSSEDFNNDPLWDEETWFDSDWEYMADAAFSLSDQSYELMVIASELPRPRPARDFHDLFTRSATTYYRADSMYYDFLASYGEEHYDEFLVLDQQAFEEYNQALDQWEDLAELYEFDPYMCH